jgi:hypothetical protein
MDVKRTMVMAGLVVALAPTAVAQARGGAGGGGGTPAPPLAAAPCATLDSNQPGQVLSGGGAAAIKLGWTAGNCSTVPETLTVSAQPRAFHVDSTGTVIWCTGTAFQVGTVTLKPGEKRSLNTVAPADSCYVRAQPLSIVYDATAADASGAALATAQNGVTVRLVP